MARPGPKETIEFALRPLVFVAAGVMLFFVALIALVFFAAAVTTEVSYATVAVGVMCGLGAFFLLRAGAICFWRASWGRAVVMRLSPDGLWNRISTKTETLPWNTIQDVTFDGGKAGGMKVLLDQQTFDRLFTSALSRIAYQLNWVTRQPKLAIHVGGLSARPREIFELTKHYAAAHRGV